MSWPLVISPPQDRRSLSGWIRDELSHWQDLLAQEGALLFRGLDIQTAEDFDAFSTAFGYQDFTYEASLSNAVRVNLTPRVFTANEAPADVEIFLHHEMAQTPAPPHKLFFCCLSAADTGGATPLCRSDWVARDLEREHPETFLRFAHLGLKYTTRMPAENNHTSGQGRSWQSTLGAQTRAEAEAKLSQLGYTWRWDAQDVLEATTPRLPAIKTLPDKGWAFFNQVIAVHLGWQKTQHGRPNLTFGDDSIITPADLEVIVDVARRHTVDLEWQDGDVALIDNHRVMHGRRPFSGHRQRRVVVTLALERDKSFAIDSASPTTQPRL